MEFSPRDFLTNHRESISGLLQSQSDLFFNDKSLAHGRIMQLIISLTTLSLTGWVGIITWKFSAVAPEWWRPISACAFLIITVLLSAISDFLVILQSKYARELVEEQKNIWLPSYSTLETKLVMMTLTGAQDPEKILTAITEHFNEIEKTPDTMVEQSKKIKQFYNYSWLIGIAGFLLFIWSICFSTYQIVMFASTTKFH